MRSRSTAWMPKWVSCALRAMACSLRPKVKGVAVSRDALSQEQPGCRPRHCIRLVGQRRLGGLALDLDRPGLLLLRDLTLQLDGQQAVGELRPDDLHMVGELEAALEVAAGDAAIEELLALVGVRRGLAGDQELVLLLRQVELGLGEARNRHDDPVGVVASLLDVVRGVAVGGLAGDVVEQVEHTIEADGRAIERRIIESTHLSHPPRSDVWCRRPGMGTADKTGFRTLERPFKRDG